MMVEIAVEHESTRLGAPFANVLTPTAVQLPTLQDVSMLIGKETGNFWEKEKLKKKKRKEKNQNTILTLFLQNSGFAMTETTIPNVTMMEVIVAAIT